MNMRRSHERREPPFSAPVPGLVIPIVPLIVFFLFLPMRAVAGTYFVDGASASCSDATGGSPTQPYCTIGAALAQHHAGGTTIVVMAGTYREQVTVPASGTAGSPIVVQASPGATVVIDGSDDYSSTSLWERADRRVYLAPSVTWAPLTVSVDGTPLTASTVDPGHLADGTFEYVAGKGLYVRYRDRNPGERQTLVGHRNYGVYVSGRAWVNVDGFTIVRAQDRGIQLTGASNIEVTRCDVSASGRFGLQIKGCSTIHVADNKLHDNGDHGISMIAGTTGCTVERNECSGNAYAPYREANGIYLFGAPKNLLRQNRLHDNQDTGLHMQSGSDSNVCVQNCSWRNGDHGYDHMRAHGNVHIGDVAYGNYKDGFSIEGNAFGQTLSDCIAIENGLTTNEYDLWVDDSSSVAIQTNDNVFWNSTVQPPVKYRFTRYALVSDYAAASGQDTRTLQLDPRFAGPAAGDFHLRSDSPAIDNADSSLPDWPANDADGRMRYDDLLVANRGMGPVPYADRGAFEYIGLFVSGVPPSMPPPPPRSPRGDGLGAGITAALRAVGSDVEARVGWPNLVVQPNPMHRGGSLSFRLSQPGRVTATVFTVDGRRVRSLMDGYLAAGVQMLEVSSQDDHGETLPEGIYFCEVMAPEGRVVTRFVVVP